MTNSQFPEIYNGKLIFCVCAVIVTKIKSFSLLFSFNL